MDERTWRLPGYVLERPLGAGSSGQVWLARVRSTGRPVAVKRIALADPEQRRAALREAAVLGSIDHPHLVRLHEVVPLPGVLALVLDLAAGGTLARLLAVRGRLAPGEVITALAPIAAALAQAHVAGVVHGDVSPSNVLFTDEGFPLLADLGLARLRGESFAARGTPAYLDPVVAAGRVPGPPSDVFMIAGCALHALTGAPVWPGERAAEVVALAASGAEVDAERRLVEAGTPAAMVRVLCRALDPNPAARGSAADFALELGHAGDGVAVELAAGREVPTDGETPSDRAAPADRGAHTGRDETAIGTAFGIRGVVGDTGSDTVGDAVGGTVGGIVGDAAAGRPSFARPEGWPRGGATRRPNDRSEANLPAAADSPAFTYGARLPSPFGEHGTHRAPRGPRRRPADWLSSRWTLRRPTIPPCVLAVTAAVLTALAVVAVALHNASHPRPRADGGPTGAVQTVVTPPTTGRPRATQGSATAHRTARTRDSPADRSARRWGAVPPRQFDAATAQQVLAHLDATRAAAFARRNPALLAAVYPPGSLRDQDTALVRAIVPPGCGLVGVRSRYSAIRVLDRTATSVRIRVRARLEESRLTCAGRAGRQAPGAGPVRLVIELGWADHRYRIERQQVE